MIRIATARGIGQWHESSPRSPVSVPRVRFLCTLDGTAPRTLTLDGTRTGPYLAGPRELCVWMRWHAIRSDLTVNEYEKQ